MTLCIAKRNDDGSVLLAADRRMVTADHGIQQEGKLFLLNGLHVAFSGDVAVEYVLRFHPFPGPDITQVQRWWLIHVKPEIDRVCVDSDYSVIVTDGSRVYVTADGLLRETATHFVAVGSAAAFAYGYYVGSSDFTCGRLFDDASRFDEKVSAAYDMVEVPNKTNKKRKSGKGTKA